MLTEANEANKVNPIPLKTAQNYARHLFELLEPHIERMMVAGSIRRERPTVNDVDIVCIPKTTVKRDLLGEVTERRNHCHEFLIGWVEAERTKPITSFRKAAGGEATRFLQGGEAGRDPKQLILQLPKCQLDLWFAEPENFASRLLMRTGSKEHNIVLCQRAQALGGKWEPYEGLTLNGALMPARTEEEIYQALGMEWIDPVNREIGWLRENVRELPRENAKT